MNKSDIIDIVAERTRMTRRKIEEAINLIFDSMTETMARGGRIEIRGLGSFMVKDYGAYVGRNPRTGEKIDVKPKRLPFFKAGKELKDRVDGKGEGGGEASSGSAPVPSNG